MTIRISGFEFSTWGGIFVKVPFIGAVHYSRELGLTWDSWNSLKATDEAW